MRRRNVRTLTTVDGEQIILPTADENRSINEQITGDPEDFELDDDWFEGAKPTGELFPNAHEQAMKRKADLNAGHIETVLITLDRETIDWFKSQAGEDGTTGGTAWIALVERAVQLHASVAKITGDILPGLPEVEEFSRLLMRLREQ